MPCLPLDCTDTLLQRGLPVGQLATQCVFAAGTDCLCFWSTLPEPQDMLERLCDTTQQICICC